jgi:hypothetical protein
MRNLLLLVSVLLLSVLWAAAQSYPSQTGQTASSDSADRTVQGCLNGSGGNYTLTDHEGNSYKLSGEPSKLSEHLGHEIEITGTLASVPESPGASTAAGSAPGPKGGTAVVINVTTVKHVSDTCKTPR